MLQNGQGGSGHDGFWVHVVGKYFEVLGMMGICKTANLRSRTSWTKETEPNDEEFDGEAELYRKAVCILLYPARRRPNSQSEVRWMCKRLKDSNRKSWRQLVKRARFVKGSTDSVTLMPRNGALDKIEYCLDGDS